MDSYDIKKLKGLYALAKYMSSRTDELKEPYVEVLSIDQRKHGTSYIEDEIEPYGTYLTELPELTDSKFFKNIGSAVKYSEKLMEKDYIDDVYISVNIFLFGLGSFLCFIIAVTESKDRFLISGVFLLLFTFVNNKLINLLFEKL